MSHLSLFCKSVLGLFRTSRRGASRLSSTPKSRPVRERSSGSVYAKRGRERPPFQALGHQTRPARKAPARRTVHPPGEGANPAPASAGERAAVFRPAKTVVHRPLG